MLKRSISTLVYSDKIYLLFNDAWTKGKIMPVDLIDRKIKLIENQLQEDLLLGLVILYLRIKKLVVIKRERESIKINYILKYIIGPLQKYTVSNFARKNPCYLLC